MSLEAIAEALPQTRPLDEHNEKLVRNVHPPDWVNPEPSKRYNIVVIGAGTAGLVTAAGVDGNPRSSRAEHINKPAPVRPRGQTVGSCQPTPLMSFHAV